MLHWDSFTNETDSWESWEHHETQQTSRQISFAWGCSCIVLAAFKYNFSCNSCLGNIFNWDTCVEYHSNEPIKFCCEPCFLYYCPCLGEETQNKDNEGEAELVLKFWSVQCPSKFLVSSVNKWNCLLEMLNISKTTSVPFHWNRLLIFILQVSPC